MKPILALDQGTTSSRAIVFDQSGEIRSVAQREFPQLYPKPGWVEHNPGEIWKSQREVAAEALSKAGLTAKDISAIGISNQRETAILWDRATGEPIHNAIVWQDRRTSDICDRLKTDGYLPLLRNKTGLVADAYFSGSKIQWMLDHVPGARARAEAGELAFGTVDSWLIWNLTGGQHHVTDHTNASRTMLYDLHKNDWDDELLKMLRVPRSLLPRIVDTSGVVTDATIPELRGIPIAGIAGDQHAALFGQMCVEPGMAKSTYGTGCFILLNIGSKPILSRHDLVTTVAWRIGGQTEYAQEGSVFIGGAAVQWLRDGLGLIQSSAEAETLAASVEDNGGVYFVPAFVGLGAPHWDQRARGAIVGITRGVTAGHLARAALEGIAFQVMDVLDSMRAGSSLGLSQIRVDGGASANDLLMQFQSDILGIPVVRPVIVETTALGAAFLAGLATGCWKDREEISRLWNMDRRFEPTMPPYEVEHRRSYWEEALQRAKDWERHD